MLSMSRGESTAHQRLLHLLDPRHLDRFEDFFPAVLRVVVEIVELLHPLEEVGEAHGERVHVGIFFRQGDGDLKGVSPLHHLISFTMLMVYFGISMVRSLALTIAWQDSREFGSSPHALSSRSSSFSSEGDSVSKPSRTTTRQLVQAQDV